MSGTCITQSVFCQIYPIFQNHTPSPTNPSILGTNDMEIRQLCIQSLANFSANNRRNKEFLCQLDILRTLRHLLFDTEALLDEATPLAEVLEDIQENALTAFRNLLSGHTFEQEVQQQLLQQSGADFFLRKLHQMRPALVRKSLLVRGF